MQLKSNKRATLTTTNPIFAFIYWCRSWDITHRAHVSTVLQLHLQFWVKNACFYFLISCVSFKIFSDFLPEFSAKTKIIIHFIIITRIQWPTHLMCDYHTMLNSDTADNTGNVWLLTHLYLISITEQWRNAMTCRLVTWSYCEQLRQRPQRVEDIQHERTWQ